MEQMQTEKFLGKIRESEADDQKYEKKREQQMLDFSRDRKKADKFGDWLRLDK